jgi:hypothetical protein
MASETGCDNTRGKGMRTPPCLLLPARYKSLTRLSISGVNSIHDLRDGRRRPHAPCFRGTFPGGLPQNSSLFVIFETPSYPLRCTYRVDCGLCDLCIGARSESDASTLTRKQSISTGPPKIRPSRRLPESALMTLETSLSAPDQQEQLYTDVSRRALYQACRIAWTSR